MEHDKSNKFPSRRTMTADSDFNWAPKFQGIMSTSNIGKLKVVPILHLGMVLNPVLHRLHNSKSTRGVAGSAPESSTKIAIKSNQQKSVSSGTAT